MGSTDSHVLEASALRRDAASVPAPFAVSHDAAQQILAAATAYLLALWHTTLESQRATHLHPSLVQLRQDVETRYRSAPGIETILLYFDDIRSTVVRPNVDGGTLVLLVSDLVIIEGWVLAVIA